MNKDIRLLVSFKNHRKRKRLDMVLGKGSIDYLIDLWLTVAEDRPEGALAGWDEIDIALAANYDGEPRTLVDALVECKWLDKLDDDTYVVHDWEEHQGWASSARQRSEAAKKAAKARWEKKLGNGDNHKSKSDQCASNAPAMPPDKNRNAPSPSPSPSPSPDKSFSPSADGADGNGKPFYPTKKGRKLSGWKLEAFNRFWEAFDKKEGKAEAAESWLNISDLDEQLVEKIISAAEKEAKRRPALEAKGRTSKMAQGWLSGRRWEDEIIDFEQTSPQRRNNNGDTRTPEQIRADRLRVLSRTSGQT